MADSASVAHQGEACPAGTTCDTGLECVKYRGVGGNELASCEIRCEGGVACPTGQTCATVKDGPGQVCISTKAAAPKTAHRGEHCSGSIACDDGLTCTSYHGVSGAEIRTCERACAANGKCPGGEQCTTVRDGPSNVCIASSSHPKTAHRGDTCSDSIACDDGLACTSYRTIAGKEVRTCDIQCGVGGSCPAGESCMFAADGPQNVCRKKTDLPVPPVPTGGAQGKACENGKCADGLECIEYFGIAGPRGPKFTSCEIRCSKDQPCKKPQRCATIADGPGQVCRP